MTIVLEGGCDEDLTSVVGTDVVSTNIPDPHLLSYEVLSPYLICSDSYEESTYTETNGSDLQSPCRIRTATGV